MALALGALCVAGEVRAQAREIRVELEAAVPLQSPGETEPAAAAPRSRALDAGIAEALRGVLLGRLAEVEGQPAAAEAGTTPGPEQPGAQPALPGPGGAARPAPPAAAAPAGAAEAAATAATAMATEATEATDGAPGEHAPEPIAAPDVLDMLPGDPSDYVLRYRVLELIGERPAAPGDAAPETVAPETAAPERPGRAGTEFAPDGEAAGEGGAPALEFALRLEVVLDGGRIQNALQEAGFAPVPGDAAGAFLRIAVERPPSWRLLTRFRRALLEAGASRAVPLELGPRRALLLVEGADPARLEAALAGASSAELSVTVLDRAPELVRVTLSQPAAAPEAPGAGPGAGTPPGGEN